MPSLPPAGPSRPAPASTSSGPRFPLSFAVHTDDPSSSSTPLSDSANREAFHSLGRTVASRAISHTKLSLTTRLAWVERLSDGSCELDTLREALPELDSATWNDLLEERHSANLCPYPVCDNKAGRPYTPGSDGQRVKLRGGSLVQGKGGKSGAGAYCSVRCLERSEWAQGMVGTERSELMEDIEDRRAELARVTREIRAKGAEEHTARQLPLPPLPTSDPAQTADLLTTLTIVEKETPAAPPAAPSLATPSHDFERPLAAPPTGPAPRRANRPIAKDPSLLGLDTSSITRTVLRASEEYAALPGAGVRTRQPEGLNGLPPPRWTSDPVMVDREGREVDWVFVDEEGESDELKDLMELALASRKAALEEEALEGRIERAQRE